MFQVASRGIVAGQNKTRMGIMNVRCSGARRRVGKAVRRAMSSLNNPRLFHHVSLLFISDSDAF